MRGRAAARTDAILTPPAASVVHSTYSVFIPVWAIGRRLHPSMRETVPLSRVFLLAAALSALTWLGTALWYYSLPITRELRARTHARTRARGPTRAPAQS